MRNPEQWTPSKYVIRDGRLEASRDRRYLSPGSWLHATLVARAYERFARPYFRGDLADLGCGRVPLYELYAPLVRSVTCIDWARSRHGNDHVDHVCSLSERLPIASSTMDTVLLSDVIEHLSRPAATMSEIARILRPGGSLILNTPFLYALHEEPHDFQRITRHGLSALADDAGLKCLVLEETGGPIEVLADIAAKVVMGAPVAGSTLAMGLQRVADVVGRMTRGLPAARTARHHWPAGYLMVARRPAQASGEEASP